MSETMIELRNATKAYFRVRALDGVNCEIRKGTIVGLLGPNGSGKSTLLKLVAGLVKPTAGEVLVDGKPPSVTSRAKVAYLPEIDYLYSWMTVSETLAFVSAFFADWSAEKATGLLAAMNLDPLQQVGKLSKGMRARLKIVLTMARDAPLVLLDEPLSGIDVPSRAKIVRAIVSEFRGEAQTIIVSTHEVADTESIFEDVLMLDKGKVRLYGDAEQLRAERATSIQGIMEEEYA